MTEQDEANRNAPVGESKTDADAGGSKADGSKKDQPSDPPDALKKDEPTPVVSVEDSKTEKLAAGATADEAKIDQLVAVNRELGMFLEEQLEAVLSLRKSVASLEGFIQTDATLKKKYEKFLESVGEGSAAPSPDLQKYARLRGIFSRLQRFGTL